MWKIIRFTKSYFKKITPSALKDMQERYDFFQSSMDELSRMSDLLCPLKGSSYTPFGTKISGYYNNSLLYEAISEKIEKIKKKQSEISL